MAFTIGSCEARPGAMTFGWLDALTHFDGTPERLPVVIAAGKHDGPCLWVTGNIHGNEYVGLLAAQGGVTRTLAGRLGDLRGTVVCIPSLNPAGLRVGTRQPYYDAMTDPNRTFPDADKQPSEELTEDEEDAPTPYETVSGIYFDRLRETATYLVDLHAMDLRSVPFTIRDHVLYKGEEHRAAAEQLSATLDGLAHAFGIPVINEYRAKKYLKSKLHRSTAGAAVHVAGIPAITPELGMSRDVDPAALRAGEDGVLRTEKEGWVLNLRSGVAAYPNRPVMDLATRDDDPLVEPWPEKQ